MRWRKRPIEPDLSAIKPAPVEHVDLSALPEDPWSKPRPPVDLQDEWDSLGEGAWPLLQRARMNQIFTDPLVAEFDRYMQLISRSSNKYRQEVFVGVDPRTNHPMFVPKRVFSQHAYILGGSGSGKTSYALAQLLIQLSEAYTDTNGVHHRPPPILIIDLKQSGDRYLRALAERLAIQRGGLRFFSNDPQYKSMTFDPFYCLRSIDYPLKLVETILNALSMIYREGYGSDFFTAEQRKTLLEVILKRPRTFDSLVEEIRKLTLPGQNPDARGLYSAIASLTIAFNLHTDGSPIANESRIDLDRFFDHGEIMYVHLDTRSMKLLSREIGKLLLFALLETAAQREKNDKKTQAFVVIDEFHRLAAQNVIEMFEDARSCGVGFILAHQSSSSLRTREEDLYGILFENCSFKQCLTLEDPRVIELFQVIAGRTVERQYSGSETFGRSIERNEGISEQHSAGTSISNTFGEAGLERITEGNTWGDSSGTSKGIGKGQSRAISASWTNQLVSALTPEMIAKVNDRNLLSLVHVKGAGDNCLTPTGGVPIVVQGIYPFTEKQAQKLSRDPWPMQKVNPDEYYRKGGPALKIGAQPRPQASEATSEEGQAESPAESVSRHNEGEFRALVAKLRTMAQRFRHEMIDEIQSVDLFGRRHGLGTDKVIELARAAGFDISDGKALLSSRQARTLRSLLEQTDAPG